MTITKVDNEAELMLDQLIDVAELNRQLDDLCRDEVDLSSIESVDDAELKRLTDQINMELAPQIAKALYDATLYSNA